MKTRTGAVRTVLAAVGLLVLAAPAARAHCDTLDGPVVGDAREALKQRDVTPVLKWVRAEDEAEIREAFDETLEVRELNETARELADRYFFETLVRVHRAVEGAPYTGLKPAGTEVAAGIRLADEALETGSVDEVVERLQAELEEGVGARLKRSHALRQHAAESVAAGREYVEAYVEAIHYVEGLHGAIEGAAHGHGNADAGAHADGAAAEKKHGGH
ncbi:MAG TPA: DUF6448 family protein [Candidatus Sumerlaeota bacterium]|nr:DUF6448 family protein [Candidatus Sumerlaeota bacterium]